MRRLASSCKVYANITNDKFKKGEKLKMGLSKEIDGKYLFAIYRNKELLGYYDSELFRCTPQPVKIDWDNWQRQINREYRGRRNH